MDKTKLLSIGTLSKLTGVHIKSLRYYDKIGILPPAYVDPDTKYRYYSFSQLHVVDAIQLCVDLDIPLKQFPEFAGSENREIYFGKLLARGTELANAKIQSIQDRLNFLHQVQEELLRTQRIQRGEGERVFLLPEKNCLVRPYSGAQNTVEYYRALNQLFEQLEQEELKPGYDCGLLMISKRGQTSRYIFLDVDTGKESREDLPGWMKLPASRYVFAQSSKSDIMKALQLFLDLFAPDRDTIVMEVEAISAVNDTSAPLFELRCSVPDKYPRQMRSEDATTIL